MAAPPASNSAPPHLARPAATDENHPPTTISSSSPPLSPSSPDSSDLPTLTGELSVDHDRLNELSFLTRKSASSTEISPTSPTTSLSTLLSRGQFLKYRCTARLSSTTFGTYNGQPACQILLSLAFHASDTSQFRWARIALDVESRAETASVAAFAPEERYGEPASATVKTSLSAGASVSLATPGGARPNLVAGRSRTSERVKTRCWKMEGSVDWDPATTVEWTITENKVDPAGLPSKPKVAVLVTHGGEAFTMRLKLAATTRLGLPIACERMGVVVFNPDVKATGGMRVPGVKGGSVGVGDTTFVGDSQGEVMFAEEELEALTQF